MKRFNILPYMLMLAIGFSLHNVAMSSVPSKVAVVNVNGLLSQSSQFMALTKEQRLKVEELQKWTAVAKADVDKQKTQEGKDKLIKKYEADFIKKQEALQKDYATQLNKIDKEISDVIAQEAKAKGYDLVLTKNVVLYGADDITKAVAKSIK